MIENHRCDFEDCSLFTNFTNPKPSRNHIKPHQATLNFFKYEKYTPPFFYDHHLI